MCKSYLLLLHWGKIPDVTHNGPACHHHQQVGGHRVLGAVPEGVAELGVVLDSDGVDGAAHLKRPLLELHDAGVIDAGALREDEDGKLLRVGDMLLKPPEHRRPILGFSSLKPDLGRCLGQGGLKMTKKASVFLPRLEIAH